MPKPFLPSAFANATTVTHRVVAGIRNRYRPSSTPQTSNPHRYELINTRQCRCHRRCFSQLTPKPLARLHDRRDIDAILFSRSSAITLQSNRNRQKDDRHKDKSANQPGHILRYDLPPGTEGGGDHKPPDERVLRLGKSTSPLPFYLEKTIC
jgi:hypothetical protein